MQIKKNPWHDAKTDKPKESGVYLTRTNYGMYRVYAYSAELDGWNLDLLTGGREDENKAIAIWQKIILPNNLNYQN